jgi:hypothetical protein
MSLVARFFHAWERRLAREDDLSRRLQPFDWGADYLPSSPRFRPSATEPRSRLHEHVELALKHSDEYFAVGSGTEFHLDEGGRLRYRSPAPTGVAENDVVRGRYFAAPSRNGGPASSPAVVVLPQWNARGGAQEGLCRLLNRFGLTALKLQLPYHEDRMPPELVRADYTLSPNVGRTLQSCRQAVLDARAAVGWLAERGHHPLGIVGTSLGSAIAFVLFAHDERLEAGVFNHVSPYFADVVWRGISTRHVRQGLEGFVDLDELRKLWLPLSPSSYYQHVKRRNRPSLLVHGRYDLSFLPDLSRELLGEFERLRIEHEAFELPCGHYTTAKFPFNWMDGLRIASFLKKSLRRAHQ